MAVQDRRVRRTQELLAKALIAVTLEKGYEAVTIRDITARADVSYPTFFRHYRDKDELLRDVSEVVVDELTDLLCLTTPDADPVAFGEQLFRYVQQHAEVVRVLLRTQSLRRRFVEAGTRGIARAVSHLPESGVPGVPPEILVHHILTSTMSLVLWWLDQRMPYSPERMGQVYSALIWRPLGAYAPGP
jgi:AcrR family transcriptional regulator